jgi:hypothetical protein
MAVPDNYDAIDNHLSMFFDEGDEIMFFHEKESSDFHLDVCVIKPNKEYRDYTILLTRGVSSMLLPRDSISKYIELCILLPPSWDLDNWKDEKNFWPLGLIRSTGRYPSENNTWLGFGHTIPNVKPEPGTDFMGTLVTKSITLPDDFQRIKYGEDTIEIFTLVPLYIEELKYARDNGSDALLDLFDKENIGDIIDVNRKNVCK